MPKQEIRPMSRMLSRRKTLPSLVSIFAALGLLGACSSSHYNNPTYSLGGTVSGLTASGLVLANGSDTLKATTNATTFSLPTRMASGATYAVTVQSQPTGQICSVTNGSGTMGTADVANVVVACSAQSFSLGGTVTGLTSSGLVLANGSDTVNVAANATTFTLPTPVALGSSYAMTVQAQPAGLACAVTQGTGTMPASNVSTVVVTCTDQPFNLGGSISGLTTSGLVLTNGSDTLTVKSGATNFTMPAQVAYGSKYAVTVHAQPTGLTCTVSNGSGTMPAAAVTNVAIACADQAYAVGGTIIGLTASGLVLANGSDTLTLPSGATSFIMPINVAYGSQYAVTVQSQPSGLTCSVSNGTGTMSANPVTNVAITCAVNTYTVGGSISGLTATGLVLANGTDGTPPLGASATVFTMPTGVASGATYNVVVRTQPAGQICTVSNGSGAVVTSAITSISISCGSNVVSFTTAGSATWTVPDGVTSLAIAATGGGGGGAFFPGGNGGVVTATLTVSPGDVLTLEVGGGGGTDGLTGGGGGSTNVNAGTTNQIIAGGGGGAGIGSGGSGSGGNGGGNGTGAGSNGNGGNPSGGSGGSGGNGGAGGAPTGGTGGNGNGGPGGIGGRGGTAGSGSGTGSGGVGGNNCCGGAGGGGYGGGGGAGGGPSADGGGGGGGSVGPTGTVYTVGTNGGTTAAGGHGSIVITASP
jgi:hypothetical protein